MSDINIGAISEALNNKVDLPTPAVPQDAVDYVIEMQRPTADNSYTWYRKYKSGWVEQGGKDSTGSGTKTVTLPIVMKDSDYTILTTTQSSTATHNASINGGTTTSFTVVKSNTICFWQVSGMSAS